MNNRIPFYKTKVIFFFLTFTLAFNCEATDKRDLLVSAFELQQVQSAPMLYKFADSLFSMNVLHDNFYNAIVNKWKAYYFLKSAKYELADSFADAALKTFESLPHTFHLTDAMMVKGQIEESKGNLDIAYNLFLKCLNLSQKENEKYFSSRAILSLGDIFYDLKQYESAKKYFYKAYSLPIGAKTDKIEGAALMRLGNIALEENEIEAAILYYKHSIAYFEKITDMVSVATAKMNIGVCYERQDEHEKANEIFSNILFTFYDNEEYLLAGNCLFNIGNVYSNKGNLKEAIHYYDECLVIAEKTKNKILFVQVYEQLSEVYSVFGDSKNAFKYLNLFRTETDSLRNGKMVQRVHNAELKFETERKNEEIQKIKNEKLIAEAEARNSENIRKFLLAGITLLLIIIILVWFNLRHRIRNRELKLKQNQKDFDSKLNEMINVNEQKISDAMIETQISERKRIAADLHDRVGSMLSAVKLFLNAGLKEKKKREELFSKALNLLDDSTNEIRNISQNLEFDSGSEFGLVKSLEELCEHLNGVSSTEIIFSSHVFENLNNRKLEVTVFRIGQELLANAIKHAKAKNIEVQLTIHPHSLNLIVQDFGIGFNSKIPAKDTSMGLRNIKSRLEEWSGKINIDSSENHGTTVIIEIEF